MEADVFPSVLLHMAHRCPQVRKNAAALIRDVVKHSVDLAMYVVNMGAIGTMIEALAQTGGEEGACVIPCVTALGYIAGGLGCVYKGSLNLQEYFQVFLKIGKLMKYVEIFLCI